MPDTANPTEGDRFLPSVAHRSQPFGLKGSSALDWGTQNRLAQIFRPSTGRTVMPARDEFNWFLHMVIPEIDEAPAGR